MDYKISPIPTRNSIEIINPVGFQMPNNIVTGGGVTGVNKVNPYTLGVSKDITDDVQNKAVNYGKSELGTDVYSQVTFGSAVGENPEETHLYTGVDGLTYAIPKITFQAILISVSFPRNIVKTEIQGRNGTVKEYIGEGDAQISFRGVITGKNGHYPRDEVNALKMLIKAPVSIPVVSDYLNNLDIYNIVFDGRSLEQEEGGYSYQAFSLNAMSDYPVELHITQ
jgi:hypothetical protein